MKSGESKPKKDHWFQDMLWTLTTTNPLLLIAIIAILAGLLLPRLNATKKALLHDREVVLYCAQDLDFAEPILRDFEKETGIQVRAVYDSEAVKTVGLANRLLAERAHPQADVFWGNEEFRTRQLAAAGVFATNDWTPLTGYLRMRMFVVNTNLVKPDAVPRSLSDLTNAAWRGKVALAYPLFGTTATHFLALRQAWGQARWLDWCRALAANKPFVVDGNSVVVSLVGRGEAWIGLTDSDDVAAGRREGLPIAAASLGSDTLRIPNTVGIVQGARHRANAERLAAYLNHAEVKERLAQANAFAPLKPGDPRGLTVNWDALLADQPDVVQELRQIFLQ